MANLDPKKLHELGSRPGTFPEMVQATYQAGLDAAQAEIKVETGALMAVVQRNTRRVGWTLVALLALCGGCLLLHCMN